MEPVKKFPQKTSITTAIALLIGSGLIAFGLFTGNQEMIDYGVLTCGVAGLPLLLVIKALFNRAHIPVADIQSAPVISPVNTHPVTTGEQALNEMNGRANP